MEFGIDLVGFVLSTAIILGMFLHFVARALYLILSKTPGEVRLEFNPLVFLILVIISIATGIQVL